MTFELPPANVLWTLGAIFALLVAASTAVWTARRLKPGLDLAEVALRIRSWWVMAAVFAVALLVSRTVSLVFFAFLSFLALKEFFSLIPTRRALRSSFVEDTDCLSGRERAS